ncbi:MAG: ATP-dependent helicase [Porcipelethomonas sp.]
MKKDNFHQQCAEERADFFAVIRGKTMDFSEFISKYNIILNDQQQTAVQAVDGANLLIAVPGSGKTTVLVARLGYMILCRNIPPEKILAMTYTTSAAADMKKRFISAFGRELGERIGFRTINSVCYEIIRYYSRYTGRPAFEMIDHKTRTDILRRIYMEITHEYPTDSDIQGAESVITYIKNMMLTDDGIKHLKSDVPDICRFYKSYDASLKSISKMDYDDQMRYAFPILLKNPPVLKHFQDKFRYICVDEAQDTSKLQHTIIRLLGFSSNNVFMVGDEDQSIYGFRAAYPKALMSFKEDYRNASVMFMEKNYRSTEEIVTAASKFIEKNISRYKKKLTATQGHGDPVCRIPITDRNFQYTLLLDKLRSPGGQTAVLYRDNDCALPLIDLFIRNNIPYRVSKLNMNFFSHKTAQDVKAFISLAFDHCDIQAFMQIYYKCGFGFSKKAAQTACDKSREKGIAVTKALKRILRDDMRLYSSACDFEKFIHSIKKFKPYDALEFIEKKYGRYLKKNNIGSFRFEILKMLAARETSLRSFMERLDSLPELITGNNTDDSNAVILSTIHSAKGLEYDTVYLMDVYDGILPSVSKPMDTKDEDFAVYEEERRLFYVAMTRARKKLFILCPESKKCSFSDEVFSMAKPEDEESGGVYGPRRRILKRGSIKSVTVNGDVYRVGGTVIHRINGFGTITEIKSVGGDPHRHTIRIRQQGGRVSTYELEILVNSGLISVIK